MAEAYFLAGKLLEAKNDYHLAFGKYERHLMPFLQRKQEAAAKFASAFAPRT